jgi:hypothetical protein
MQETATLLSIIKKRDEQGLPLKNVFHAYAADHALHRQR